MQRLCDVYLNYSLKWDFQLVINVVYKYTCMYTNKGSKTYPCSWKHKKPLWKMKKIASLMNSQENINRYTSILISSKKFHIHLISTSLLSALIHSCNSSLIVLFINRYTPVTGARHWKYFNNKIIPYYNKIIPCTYSTAGAAGWSGFHMSSDSSSWIWGGNEAYQ